MKKLSASIPLMLFALAALYVAGCKSKALPKGEEEVNIPCSGSDYFTNAKFFRANSLGESMDLAASKKKALANARGELAASIQTTVKAVTDNYLNSREMNNKEEIEERFEQLNREVVNQKLQGIKTICEKQVKTNDGTYKTYIAIELSADDLVASYNERLSKDERLRIDYDYEKFKETFNQEMEKFAN
ncbi:MAG: LPP20 family lipoprotein [Cyclobacteriaceae bacterium]|jgi:hypothetical protein|nr:LPP20 family lipoprotein [Cyclobacteriaceae bacterium]